MLYHPKTSSKFIKIRKKLPAPLRAALDDQVRAVCANPLLGTLKTGDLAGVRVHKFGCLGTLYLLAYGVHELTKTVYIYAVGGHENFYRELKLYLNR
ncbi:MAG: type II toxin-antitoxin system RelE/ParE family toxin [Candidatus Bipolaricaulia bacterium]